MFEYSEVASIAAGQEEGGGGGEGTSAVLFVELLRTKMMVVIISQPHKLPVSPKRRPLVKQMVS